MFYRAFPRDLRENLHKVTEILPAESFNNVPFATCGNIITYTLDDSVVEIPYRMYLLDVADAAYETLSQAQKQILCCIYTRSCDGYIREKYLRKLLDMPMELWIIPFIVKLCDEYVIEILEIIYDKLKERDNTNIQAFCLNNKSAIRKSYARMISYWNVYYRRHEWNFKEYIGRKLFEECLGYDA
ncbi:MAG: hypothetical protein IJZ08_02205 [Clostridia bacterium]|nr:hypothetical protein [Clostridia bacterium]